MTERHIRNANEAANLLAGDQHNVDNTTPVGIDEQLESKDDANEFLPSQLLFSVDYQTDHDDQMADEPAMNDASGSGVDEGLLDPISEQRKPNMVALSRAVRQSQQQILVIQTGGTIDKDYPRTIRGYAFEIGEPAAQRVFERVGLELPVVFRTVCRKDSQEITADDRYLIFDCCANAPQQRILITHGSDTLLETAAYLSEFSDLGSKIIVLTGAMKPETFRNSDADFNIGCALGALQSLSIAGVYVSMHGIVARWDLIQRDASTHRFIKKPNPAYI
jgi:L-asparaginase